MAQGGHCNDRGLGRGNVSGTMAAALTRRAFLAGAVAVPATRGLARQSAGPVPPTADVVVISGDPGALTAVYRRVLDQYFK